MRCSTDAGARPALRSGTVCHNLQAVRLHLLIAKDAHTGRRDSLQNTCCRPQIVRGCPRQNIRHVELLACSTARLLARRQWPARQINRQR